MRQIQAGVRNSLFSIKGISKEVIMKKVLLIFVIILNSHPIRAQLFINEFMASNDTTIVDDFGEHDDWIEIYNDDEHSVNLSGFYLTDNLHNPTKWSFPDISIAAKGYLLIWADDTPAQGNCHTNYKLDAEGEQIGLYNGNNFVDSLTFGQQSTDISYGRYPDGGVNWIAFTEPTPNASNDTSILEHAEVPKFSHQGGFYSGSVTLELGVTSPTAKIYYTLDCYEPTKTSLLYTGPILISKTTVVRARAYEDSLYPSEIRTYTYIFNENFNIATLSLVTDPPSLWDPDSGIYVNYNERGDEWERYTSVEFYKENDDFGFSENAGLRIHGGGPRSFPKKSFRLYLRNEYGQNWLEYPLFETKSHIREFKRLILMSGSVDMPASDWPGGWTLLRDPLMHEFSHRIKCIYAANRPVAVFLNQEPWGIYNLFERPDQYFTYSNFGKEDVDIIEDGRNARVGDMVAWQQMIQFFENNDLHSNSNYEIAKTLIDIDNYTDYCIFEIYSGNRDWPYNNYIAFRPRNENTVWRWILWDMDGCFRFYGLNFNTLEWAISDTVRNTLILRSLIENEDYKNAFINRYADLMNTIFSPLYCISLIDSFASVIRNDISFETDKWGSSPQIWEKNGLIGSLYYFTNRRPAIAKANLESVFSLSGNIKLKIVPPKGGQGSVKVNSICINTYPWEGIYFREVPVLLTAIPNPGYDFVGWSDPSLPQIEEISITLISDSTIYAIFEAKVAFDVIINEINYNSNSNFNPEDWIELYNPSYESIDVSGWHLKDDNDTHDFTFPQGSAINAYGYLVVCRDQALFRSLFPEVKNYIGNLDFGLSSNGDQVRVFNSSLLLIDSVQFDDTIPWPTEPDGNGPTLELIDPELENTLPENWQASYLWGTPGQPNSYPFSISGKITYYSNGDAVPQTLMLLTGYINKITTTDSDGYFCFTTLNSGDYRLKAHKENDIRNTADVFDALWILQYVVGLNTFSPYQMIAGDVTGNDKVTAYDASYILQYSANLIDKFPIMTDSTDFWKFVPDDFPLDLTNWTLIPDSVSYTLLTSDTTDNYKGIIYGDVNGSWGLAESSLIGSNAAEATTRLENIDGEPDDKISLPLCMDGGSSITAISFVIEYNSQVMKALGASVTSLTQDYLIACNIQENRLKVALAGRKPINITGEMVNLEFKVLVPELPDLRNQLQITEIVINDGNNDANTHITEFNLGSPLRVEYRLYQNYPNPFNHETIIKYQILKPGKVVLKIFNIDGQEVRTLLNEDNEAGIHNILWDGKNDKSQDVPSGLYLYRIQVGEFQLVKKLLLIK